MDQQLELKLGWTEEKIIRKKDKKSNQIKSNNLLCLVGNSVEMLAEMRVALKVAGMVVQ